ncbi:MAG: sigma factor [Chloroflexota bacterium]
MESMVNALANEPSLIAQARIDPAAFAALYDHYFPRIYNYMRYRVWDAQVADDLTARVFERALADLAAYRPERAPFGAWLYVGGADSLLLLLGGLLALAARAGATRPRAASLAALALGALAGLAEPHGLLLIPAFGAWWLGLAASRVWMRPADDPRSLRRVLFEDASPAWAPLFAALGIALGAGAWLYQASGHYPLWPLMIVRTRWPGEFAAWSPGALARTFQDAVALAWRDQLSMQSLQRGVELAALVFGLALAFGRLPPLWAQGERIRLPLHWRVGILTPLVIMFAIGQSHALERAMVSNVFVVLAWHRLVFGEPGQIVQWKLASFPGLIRWLWLLAGPALWLLSFLLLGWEPLV